MYIPFAKATKIVDAKWVIWDYLMGKDMGISYQELTSRGPQAGRYLNKTCSEVYFVISGSGKFYVGDDVYEAGKNDVITVDPNTLHHIETTALKYITITRPDWYEEQAEIVE
jgi:mannose-6-phosphate isomerase-like protein (cupin superfamily)